MIDAYFRRPLIWDYIIATTLCLGSYELYKINWLNLTNEDHIWSTTSDLSTVSLTLSGFILTLLTVLITFKSGSKVKAENVDDNDSVFNVFFATNLYFQTVKHLKNCVKSLIFVSVFGYTIKMILNDCNSKYLFFFNIYALMIIVLTLWRGLLILTKIINLQKIK